MKKIILLLLVLTFVTSSWGQSSYGNINAEGRENKLLQFIGGDPALRKVGLYALLATRCTRYVDFGSKSSCRDAVKKVIKLLSMDVVFTDKESGGDAFIFVAFKKDLYELLAQPKTTRFLVDLDEKLNQFHQNDLDRVNIWELALFHFRSEFEAAKVLAVLFQDTSVAKLHLSYLDYQGIKGGKIFQDNKAHLRRCIETINLLLDNNEDHYGTLFYPRAVKESLNRNIYHFYVPLYLSMSLAKMGVSKQNSFVAPFMLTLTYEFITASENESEKFRYILVDPEKLDPVEHAWKMQDIYGGYAAAFLGAKGQSTPVSLSAMKKTFATSSSEAVKLLLRP